MSLDLQNVLAGHEPWSKTKQQNSGAAARARFDRSTSKKSVPKGVGRLAIRVHLQHAKELCQKTFRKTRELWVSFPLLRPLPFLVLGIALYGMARQIPSLSTGAFDRTPKPAPPLSPPAPAPVENVGPTMAQVEPRASSTARLHTSSAAPSPAHSATVNIQIENQIPHGNVTVWVDDRAVLHRQLQPPLKKKLGIFGAAQKQDSQKVQITAGQHQLRVRVQGSDPFYDQSHVLAGEFPVGSERVLRVSFSKHDEMHAGLR